MPLRDGGPHERKGEKGAPPLKRRYFAAIFLFSVEMVADSTDMLLIITRTSNGLLSGINIDDLE